MEMRRSGRCADLNCLVTKETLNEFYDSYIVLSLSNQQTALFLRCVQRCKEIISAYKATFPCDCAQLDLLLKHGNKFLNNGLVIRGMADKDFRGLIHFVKMVIHILNHFTHSYKAIFYTD